MPANRPPARAQADDPNCTGGTFIKQLSIASDVPQNSSRPGEICALDMESRQEKSPQAPIPLLPERLGDMIETHEHAPAIQRDRRRLELDLQLEYPLDRLRALRIARVDRHGSAAIGGQRLARQLIGAARHLA